MKKIIKLLVTLLVLSCLCACSNTANETPAQPQTQTKNELAALYDQGYEPVQTSHTDNRWVAVYEKDYSVVDAYKVELEMDQETCDKLFEIDTFEKEGQKQYREIVESLPGCVITSLNSELPSDDEFDKYIGKTIQDLENDGYERSGNTYNEDGCMFYADGPKYSINIKVDEVISYETIDDYSENDIRALTIKSIEFSGFSYKMFD